MISIEGQGARLCDGVTRREFLRVGALGMVGLSWADWLRLQEAGATGNKGKGCILLWMTGGPPHQDTFDMKPDAESQYRGIFKPIKTAVPGIEVCEHLPHLARHTDKLAIVRSVTHHESDHTRGTHAMLTGQFLTPQREFPHMGAVVAERHRFDHPIPTFLALPYFTHDFNAGVRFQQGQGGGFLGRGYDPIWLSGDPNAPDHRVPDLALPSGVTTVRLSRRQTLRQMVDELFRGIERHTEAKTMDASYQRALALLGSSEVRRAFDLSQEPTRLRDAYGRTTFGQSCLLARRLIERGAKFVQVNMCEDPGNFAHSWDLHGDNFNKLKSALLPRLDPAWATLLEDLQQRGMLESTLVIWMGEFGRTPQINGSAGRDHWPGCASVVLAGGGVRGGQIIGKSDHAGGYPVERPLRPGDIVASVLKALEIDPETLLNTPEGRPVKVAPDGKPIEELF